MILGQEGPPCVPNMTEGPARGPLTTMHSADLVPVLTAEPRPSQEIRMENLSVRTPPAQSKEAETIVNDPRLPSAVFK